jgi:hypothetical protein
MLKFLICPLLSYLGKLRFPYLFAFTTALFLLDLFIPDFIPFADEILLCLGATLLGNWKKRKNPEQH